jgi:hypothetical protein
MTTKPPRRPTRRPPAPPVGGEGAQDDIPPPPPTRPEPFGVVIEAPDLVEGAEDYYKRIHAHRTVLAMKAVRPGEPVAVLVDDESGDAPPDPTRAALLERVFAAEREVAKLHELLVAGERRERSLKEALRAANVGLSTAAEKLAAIVATIRTLTDDG